MTARRRTKGSGSIRKLASGRWQARYRADDGALHPAPAVFSTKLDATEWLTAYRRGAAITEPTVVAAPTLAVYAGAWLDGRELKPRTRVLYADLLAKRILPDLGATRLDKLTPTQVRSWYGSLDPAKATVRVHAYSLLKTVLATAVTDDLIATNPCRIRGASSSPPRHDPPVVTLPELEVMVAAMPERLRAMLLIGTCLGLRYGEVTEVRRADVDLKGGIVRITRGVTRVPGRDVVGTPKSHAGTRSVSIPPHLIPVLQAHLEVHVGRDPGALLFPAALGGHLSAGSFAKPWHRARAAAGRTDVHFHDLRHLGATLAAATGATLGELMARMGHSTAASAMRYQHAAADRDQAIATALSGFAGETVVPLRRRSA